MLLFCPVKSAVSHARLQVYGISQKAGLRRHLDKCARSVSKNPKHRHLDTALKSVFQIWDCLRLTLTSYAANLDIVLCDPQPLCRSGLWVMFMMA